MEARIRYPLKHVKMKEQNRITTENAARLPDLSVPQIWQHLLNNHGKNTKEAKNTIVSQRPKVDLTARIN